MKKDTFILIGFIIVKFVFQYTLIHPEYELQRDEYLHLDQANHLAWGYLSVPPVTSWISFLIKLLGNGEFWVKFFPGLFGALTMVFVWKTIEALNGNRFALILGATCVLFSAILRLSLLYQPNSLDVLSWTAFYYIVVRYAGSKNPKWLFFGAFIFAIGFLNKYNFAFLLIGLFPAVFISSQRQVLREKQFYLAILVGLLLILPNLIWQYNHNFPVIHHMQELADKHLVHVDRMVFLQEQLLYFFGSLPILAAALYALIFYRPFAPYRLFFFSLLFTLSTFVLLKAKGYYAIGLYPVYLAFGSVYLSVLLKSGWRKYLQPIFILLPVLSFIPMYQYFFPNKSPKYIIAHTKTYQELGLLRWEDGKDHALPQDFADMLGWKELAEKVDAVYAAMPSPEATLVLCDNYGQAGAINYYTRKNIRAVSFNADYINWFDLNQPYRHLIRVKNAGGNEKELAKTGPYFGKALMSDSVTNSYAREYGTTIFSFTDASINLNAVIKAEIEEERKF